MFNCFPIKNLIYEKLNPFSLTSMCCLGVYLRVFKQMREKYKVGDVARLAGPPSFARTFTFFIASFF